jgi:predicted dehydrogenase
MVTEPRKWGIGVIGCGEWGPNHIRNFSALPNAAIVAVADTREVRLQRMMAQYPGTALCRGPAELLRVPGLDAVIVATPAVTHYSIVREAILANKHVLCEKPLCTRAEEAEDLIKLAREHNALLMVGHVFLFNAGIRKLKDVVRSGTLGPLFYLVSRRTNLGPIRADVDAIWDLASHDISIANFLLDGVPTEVSAVGKGFLRERVADVGFITLQYPNGIVANVHVSWLDPKKVREITIVGGARMATWNDLATAGPVMVFDKSVVTSREYSDFGEFQLLAREGDITIPRVQSEEPLRTQARAFIQALETGEVAYGDAQHAKDVIRVLTAAEESLRSRGAPAQVA